jgi:hypothetical protein
MIQNTELINLINEFEVNREDNEVLKDIVEYNPNILIEFNDMITNNVSALIPQPNNVMNKHYPLYRPYIDVAPLDYINNNIDYSTTKDDLILSYLITRYNTSVINKLLLVKLHDKSEYFKKLVLSVFKYDNSKFDENNKSMSIFEDTKDFLEFLNRSLIMDFNSNIIMMYRNGGHIQHLYL